MEQKETIDEKRARVKLADEVRRFRTILEAVKVLIRAGFTEKQAAELIISEMHRRGAGL